MLGGLSVVLAVAGDVAVYLGAGGLVNALFDTTGDWNAQDVGLATLLVVGVLMIPAAIVLGLIALVRGGAGPRVLAVVGVLAALVPFYVAVSVWLGIGLPF